MWPPRAQTCWSSPVKADGDRVLSDNDNDKQKTAGVPTLVLDEHRGMIAQKEIDARRQQSAVVADQHALRESQTVLEKHLFARPAATWPEAAEKAAYLLQLFAATGDAQDPRYKQMIADALQDLQRLDANTPKPAR